MAIDRESIYRKLADKDWNGLVDVLSEHTTEIRSDPVAKQAIDFFETEFFGDLKTRGGKEALSLLELPHIITQLNPNAFSEQFRVQVVEYKIETQEQLGLHDLSLNLALQHPNLAASKNLLKSIKEKTPERVANATRQNLDIKATKVDQGPPKTVKLFRSKQEENFFLAMRSAFPTYDPYPNVAINAVVDFNAVRHDLTQVEREFFFRGMIDSVVFDSATSYTPLYFFELDSPYHDAEEQKKRDVMKDRIFELANAKLHRIRAYDRSASSVNEFRTLILEVVRGL